MNSKRQIKVIHVHLLCSHKNFYFGSISSMFKTLTSDEVGCDDDYLRHVLRHAGNHHLTTKALIIRSVLIRS